MKARDPTRLDRIVAEARRAAAKREQGYRQQALKIYPWICGRCGREFTHANLRELTVHHRNTITTTTRPTAATGNSYACTATTTNTSAAGSDWWCARYSGRQQPRNPFAVRESQGAARRQEAVLNRVDILSAAGLLSSPPATRREMKDVDMPSKEPGFAERLQTAAKAKKAQLEKIRATALANAAQSAERQAAQVETAKARKIRKTERTHSNRIAAAQRDAQRAAERARQARAVMEERTRKDAARVAQAEADAALKRDQKAARDYKYAARKARQT